MTFQIDKARWSQDSDGLWFCVRALIPHKAVAACDEVKADKVYDLDVKEHRNRRSLNANNYLWVLLEKLAEVMGAENPQITKDSLYIDFVRQVGVSKLMTLDEDVAKTIRVAWERLGTGWPTEQVDYEPGGKVMIRFFYGSSTYNTKQMARLIDAVVEACKEQGIDTMTPEELSRLKSLWTGERVNA